MSKIRIESHKNEPPDLMVMRLFAKLIPLMDRHAAKAAIKWMIEISADPETRFAGDQRTVSGPIRPAEQKEG